MGPPDLTNVLLFLGQRKSDLGRVGDQREETGTCYQKGGEFRAGQRILHGLYITQLRIRFIRIYALDSLQQTYHQLKWTSCDFFVTITFYKCVCA